MLGGFGEALVDLFEEFGFALGEAGGFALGEEGVDLADELFEFVSFELGDGLEKLVQADVDLGGDLEFGHWVSLEGVSLMLAAL